MASTSGHDDSVLKQLVRRRRKTLIAGGVVLAVLSGLSAALSLFDWNLLRGPIGRQASLMTGRVIRIEGDLKVHLLSFTPSATADDLHIGASNGLGGDLARVGRFGVAIKLLPLLWGQVELPLIDLQNPVITAWRDASGRANWQTPADAGKPAKLPLIRRFVINNGRFHLVDQTRRMVLDAALQSSETLAAHGRAGAFQLRGQGSLNSDPFSLSLSGGPLLNVRRDRPYAFDADLRAGETHVTAKGLLTRPFDFGQVRTALTVTGGDLADLYYLTGVAFPNTSPYRLAADLARNGRTYAFSHVVGQVGRSDLAGAFQVDRNGGRPFVRADLRSRMLDLVDFGALAGVPSKGPPRSRLQKVEAVRLKAQDRLLPDAVLDVTRVRSTDAVVHYAAAAVIARKTLPLRRVKLDLTLDHGVMTLDPLAFDFPSGELVGKLRLDARGAVPQDDVDLRVRNLHIEDFLPRNGAPPLEGVVQARARFSGSGASVRQVAATARGGLTVVVPHGAVRQSLGELLGVNLTKALGLLLAKDQREMGVRCAVADFQAKDGLLTARNLVFDSDTVLTTGQGAVNLRDETMDLTFKGQSKKFRLVRLMTPIRLHGRLRSPKVGFKPGGAPLQAGAAITLGALFTPLAAVLPFVDPGLAHDPGCAGPA